MIKGTDGVGLFGYDIRFSNQFNHYAYQSIKHAYKHLNRISRYKLTYLLERYTLAYYIKQFNHRYHNSKLIDWVISIDLTKKHNKKNTRPEALIWLHIPNYHIIYFDDFKKQLHQQLLRDFKYVLKFHPNNIQSEDKVMDDLINKIPNPIPFY